MPAIRTTIDAAGRIVIPKPLRQRLGFGAGQELDLSEVDGRLVVALPATAMRLEERDGDLVAVADRALPKLTAAQIRATLEATRR